MNHHARLDLAPQRERLLELDPDHGPRLGVAARVEHHAHDAVDAEPGGARGQRRCCSFPVWPTRGLPRPKLLFVDRDLAVEHQRAGGQLADGRPPDQGTGADGRVVGGVQQSSRYRANAPDARAPCISPRRPRER